MSSTTLDTPEVRPARTRGAGPRAGVVVRRAGARWGLRGTALLYLGLMVVIPTIAVVTKGFGAGLQDLTDALQGFGAKSALMLTVVMAAVTAGVNVVFGTLLAYVIVRYRFPGRSAVSTIVDIPFAIPTLVTGVMLRALYGPNAPIGAFLLRHGIHIVFAPLGILLALLFVTLPLVVRTVQPVLLELDEAEEEAARVLGATRWGTFRSVVLPAIRPGIAAGGLLAFARALGEFGAVVIISGNLPNKTLTAPVLISQLIQVNPAQAAALSTILFAVSFALVMVTEQLVGTRHGWEQP
ncbi:MAG: sulfate ABC transporter permease subunit CysT [Actinomycetota bacterium]